MPNNKFPYRAAGNQRLIALITPAAFNIDNGAGTTADVQLGNFPFDSWIFSCRAIYSEATDTTGAASANFKLGVSAGDASLVAATALEAAKAIGGTTVAVPLAVILPANTTLWVRHTGVATTEVGQYFVQVLLLPKP
jgi:hypothetical protein